jgi:hypothetical protein
MHDMQPVGSKRKSIELLPFDERALELPPISDDVFDELVGDMVRRGFRPQFPIITHNGKIIEGVNRARACVKAGVEPVYQQFDRNDEDVERFIIQANLCRRHLKPEDRRKYLKKLIGMNPEMSDRAIATIANVSPTTVGSVRQELGSNVQVGHKGRVEKSGRAARGRKPGSPNPTFHAIHATKLGEDTVEMLKGSALASAKELDALIKLNRGAPEGQLTSEVQQLIDDAAAGKPVSAARIWANRVGVPVVSVTGTGESAAVADAAAATSSRTNFITASWDRSNAMQRLEFARAHGEQVADWLTDYYSSGNKNAPLRHHIWQSCKAIEAGLDKLEGTARNDCSRDYELLANELSELKGRIDDKLAWAEEDNAKEPDEVA